MVARPASTSAVSHPGSRSDPVSRYSNCSARSLDDATAARTVPNRSRVAQRSSPISLTARAGTLTLNAVRPGRRRSMPSATCAAAQAVSQYQGSLGSMLTASPEPPKFCAVSTAPTVPECRIECPVLSPALTPETTMSGGSPNAPSRAASTASAGLPRMPTAGMPGAVASSVRTISTGTSGRSRPMDALAPLRSSHGATTTTSSPASARDTADRVDPGRRHAVVVRHEDRGRVRPGHLDGAGHAPGVTRTRGRLVRRGRWGRRARRGQRQLDDEARAGPVDVLDPRAAAHGAGQLANDREPDAGADHPPGTVREV